MGAAFVLELAVGALGIDLENDAIKTSDSAFLMLNDFGVPPPPLGVASIHAEELGRKESRLGPARGRSNFHNHRLLVKRILGHEHDLELTLQFLDTRAALIELGLGKVVHFGITEERFGFGDVLASALILADHANDLLDFRPRLTQPLQFGGVSDHLGILQHCLDVGVPTFDFDQFLQHERGIVALTGGYNQGVGTSSIRTGGALAAAGLAWLALGRWLAPDRGSVELVQFGFLAFAGVVAVLVVAMGELRKPVQYGMLTALAVFLMAPFIWMVLVSLHPPKAPIPPLADLIPRNAEGQVDFAVSNYGFVLNHPTLPVRRFFLNSVFVTVAVVVAQLFFTSLAAYAFARLRFRGRETMFALFVGSMMFAGPVTQIPVFLMLMKLGWLDSYAALIVPGVSSAFSVFLLRQFFLQIPLELDEAARLDGASDFLIYSRVIMPLSKAALATASAFTFFGVWTDFFNPLIFTNSTEMRTLEVGLSIFKNSYGGTNWPLQMTAAVIVMTPLLIVFLFTQRYFTKGITLGSVK